MQIVVSHIGVDLSCSSYETLNRRRRSFDSFDSAIKKGQTTALTLITNALIEMALSQKNLGATIYWLKIHGGPLWRQDQHYGVEHSGEVQHNVVADRQKLVEQLRRLNDTKPELMAELRELRRREHEILDQVAEKPAIETTAREE